MQSLTSSERNLANETSHDKETTATVSAAAKAAPATVASHAKYYELLDFADRREAEFAARGLIAAPEKLELRDEDGRVIWSQAAYAFLNKHEKAPDTVNPSLWENTKNNHLYGLFKVMDGIYQVRGYDMSNLTLVEGKTGWIILDTLMSVECSRAAMQLAEEHLGKRPVRAVIISHSHVDHFGGIRGLMDAEQAASFGTSLEAQLSSGKIPIIVPVGFEKHAISENVYAGRAMERRAAYQYGVYLKPSETGRLAMGIGMGQSVGCPSYISPSFEITQTGETYTIDGVTMEFQLTPGTEAPAEMNTWFPGKKALWVAENCTATLHNLYTLRGAEVRDGAAWAKYILEAVVRYGSEVELTFQSHNWPHWGNAVVNDYLVETAAVYKFINDQTLTYINQGYTENEIAYRIRLPRALARNWHSRQYYGTVAHDAKAVYQKFMGWYDANPVHLHALPPEESARKWMAYMGLGSVEAVLRQARADFDAGEFQWVAEVTNTIVFADPENREARLLCADALEQLGYQAESGTWRNAYLTGALELRQGNAVRAGQTNISGGVVDMQQNMTAGNILDFLAILLDKAALAERDFTLNFNLVDTGERFALRFKNGAVLPYMGITAPDAGLSVTTKKDALFLLIDGQFETFASVAKLEGDVELLKFVVSSCNQFDPVQSQDFNIVEP